METKCKLAQFQVPPNAEVNLRKWKTDIKPLYDSKKHYRKQLAEFRKELIAAQNLLYAHNRYAVLLIFQGMDAAGKDGAIKHVMSGVNPQGCQVFSFKTPNSEELDHDYLCRCLRRLPKRGRIGIFNRSYYEEALVVRVHPELLQHQRLPLDVMSDTFWQERFESIADHEKHLARQGTIVIKFWLNISRDEQRARFLKRIDDPSRNWKFAMSDVRERAHWPSYMQAYEDVLNATSKPWAPWYAIPADSKPYMRAAIAEMQLGIEQRQPTVVMAHVADNFIGDAGLDRDGLYGLLRVQVLRNASIGATLGPIEIELLEGQAEVRFSALLTGGAGGLLPDRAGTYSVTTGWREIDGNWKLVTASWEREL